MCNNVAGRGGRKINYANVDIAGDFCRPRCGNNVEGNFGRRRCDFVYECLLDLLEEELRSRSRNCDFVYECLDDLLEDAGDDKDKCRCFRDC